MKKKIILIFSIFLMFSISSVYAINLDISSKPVSNSFITDLSEPATFELTIRNLGEKESFEIYSLVGIDIYPKMPFLIESGKTRVVKIEISPQDTIKSKEGFFTFEYRIKNSKNEIQKEQLTINIISLKNSFSITSSNINPKSEEIIITIKNKVNLYFKDLKIKLNSVFFDYETNLPLNPLETKDITIPIDREKTKSLNAGQYLANVEINTLEKTDNKEFLIKFLEQEDIETIETKEGLIKSRQEIIKKNVGNIKKTVEINVKKNIISYLFTTVNIPPTEDRFEEFEKHYIWKKELIPSEELKIVIITNWFYPLIILVLIILIFYFIRKSVKSDLVLRKKVSFIKTKGGQFALKITLHSKAKKFIERINIIDKLPPLVNLYEKYGAITPDKIDLNNRRIEWNIESLNKDEERIFTYIIYSRIGVIGRFELPEARAIYEKDGKIKETKSNRSFFINEPKK